MKNNKVYREELIEHIKACGQSIIDHAEEIVGNYKFDTGTYIELHVGDRNEAPYISVTKDFIPEKYLPTFNECTIELFQYKIPGLSEHYLVGNDDYLVTSPLTKDDFFTQDGTPKIT